MVETAQLAVDLRLRSQQFDDGLKRSQQRLGQFNRTTTGASKGLGAIDKSASRLGQTLRSPDLRNSILQGVGLGGGLLGFTAITAGIGLTVDALGGAIRAASDMTETQGKLDIVFRRSADTIRSWAFDANRSMGLTQQAALEAAGTFGNFLQAMDLTEEQAADMSTTIVQLGADLGAFNNLETDDALLALRSGLAGETEPLRRFGVDISDAAVKARLLADGVQAVNGQFTQSQKVQARYNIILDKTTTAQGNFVATNKDAAGAQKVLNARLGDLSTRAGQLLIGPFTDIVGLFNDGAEAALGFADAIPDVIGKLQALEDQVGQTLGRDLVNDAANAGRAMLVFPLIGDFAGETGFALEDFGRVFDDVFGSGGEIDAGTSNTRQFVAELRDVSRVTPQATEAVRDLVPEESRADIREWSDELARATSRARRLDRALEEFASGGLSDSADAARETNRRIRQLLRGDEETTVKKLNDRLQTAIKLRRRAADGRKKEAFIVADDLVQRLLKERRLGRIASREARARLNEFRKKGRGSEKERSDLDKTTTKTDKLREAVDKLPSEHRITFRALVDQELRDTLELLSNLGPPSKRGGGGGFGLEARQHGGLTTPGRAFLVGERGPELRIERQAGQIFSASETKSILGGGPMAISVRPPPVVIAAYEVNRQTTKIVATNRRLAS